MKDKKHYCKKCLTKLDYIGYCDACGHRFNDKESINRVSEDDITSYEYEGGGFIRKKITRLIKQEELSFDVIEQSIHFEHDLTLHGGSILLSPINTGKHTMITMKTNYESYVRPSWLWEPSMDYVIKTLHRYVIKDMQNDLRDPALKIAEKT